MSKFSERFVPVALACCLVMIIAMGVTVTIGMAYAIKREMAAAQPCAYPSEVRP